MTIQDDFLKYRDAFYYCDLPSTPKESSVNPDLFFYCLSEQEKIDLVAQMKLKYKSEIDDKKYLRLREAEYPNWKEFMHEFFDGDIENLRRKREAIKLKYPKPA